MHKLTQGGPLAIYAQDWNLLCDMVEQIRKGEENNALNKSAIRTYVQVYNGTSGIADEGTVWELGSPQITPDENLEDFQAHPVFSLVKPASETQGTLCVLTAPINPHEQGIGVVTGAVALKCTVNSSSDKWAKPDGKGGMVTGADGTVQLVYADTETGWCYAILGAGGGGGTRYNGYFATSIVSEGDAKEILVNRGRCFVNATPVLVPMQRLPYSDNMTVLLKYDRNNGVSIVQANPYAWSKEGSCTVIAEVYDGVLRQICHDMPVLWCLGKCEEKQNG